MKNVRKFVIYFLPLYSVPEVDHVV